MAHSSSLLTQQVTPTTPSLQWREKNSEFATDKNLALEQKTWTSSDHITVAQFYQDFQSFTFSPLPCLTKDTKFFWKRGHCLSPIPFTTHTILLFYVCTVHFDTNLKLFYQIFKFSHLKTTACFHHMNTKPASTKIPSNMMKTIKCTPWTKDDSLKLQRKIKILSKMF